MDATLAFFALGLTLVSFWVKRSPWIWGGFLVMSLALAYSAKLLTPVAFVPIAALFLLHGFLSTDLRGLPRIVLFLITATLSIFLLLDKLPGFNSTAFALPMIGLFVLAWGLPLHPPNRTYLFTLPLALASITIIIVVARFLHLANFQPRFPSTFWLFALHNLLFVSLIQEAFWRGFIQRQISRATPKFIAVPLTALIAAAIHYVFLTPDLHQAALLFTSSLLYGSIYAATRAIEPAILTHWLTALTFFLFFT